MVWITPHKTYYFRNVHPRSIPPQFLPDIMFVFLHYLSFLRRNRNHPTLPDSVTFPVHNPSGSNSHIRDRFLRSERNPYTAQSLLLGFDVLPPTDLLPMPGLAYCAKVKKILLRSIYSAIPITIHLCSAVGASNSRSEVII